MGSGVSHFLHLHLSLNGGLRWSTCRSPGLSIPWCCVPTSSSVCLVFFPPFTVLCKMVLDRPDQRETCPYHFSLRRGENGEERGEWWAIYCFVTCWMGWGGSESGGANSQGNAFEPNVRKEKWAEANSNWVDSAYHRSAWLDKLVHNL